MHVLLTIGYERILLPSEQGLQTIIKALSAGYIVKSSPWEGHMELGDRIEVAVKMMPGLRITTKRKAPCVEILNPEVIPPPADDDGAQPRRRAAGALPGHYPTLDAHRRRMLLTDRA